MSMPAVQKQTSASTHRSLKAVQTLGRLDSGAVINGGVRSAL
jgi:hypothetical protein